MTIRDRFLTFVQNDRECHFDRREKSHALGRDEAEREGQGYQTAMNQALRNYIRQDKRPIQDIVRQAVRLELSKFRKAG